MGCRTALLAAGSNLFLFAGQAAPHGVAIEHAAAGCVLAGSFVELEARFDPAGEVGRARLHFRGEGGAQWYFVEMRAEDGAFRATLPKPKKSLRAVSYYVEVVDRSFAESRGAEHTATVVPEPEGCARGQRVAPSRARASITLGATAGAKGVPPVPAGFAPDGIAGVEAKASEGGIGSPTLLAAGGAVALGAVLIATSGGDGSGGESSPSDLTGIWEGTGTDGFGFHYANGSANQPVECEEDAHADAFMSLVQSGSSLSGSLRLVVRTVAPSVTRRACHEVGDQIAFIVNGTASGTSVSIELRREGLLTPSAMNGTVEGRRMTGTLNIRNRNEIATGTWALVRR